MQINAVEHFVCPKCHHALDLSITRQEGTKVKTGNLSCMHCENSYEIVNYIPRFVDSEAYVESFGDEWHLFKRVKNDRMQMSMDEMQNYLSLEEIDITGKTVLEIGCGAGPYLEVSAKHWKAKHVFGIDLSRAVDAAYENVGDLENITIIQADLFHLPFKNQQFDVLYSLGVLHHTPNTKDAFQAVSKKVAKGGLMSVWLYGAYWLRKSANQDRIRKYITSKLSSRQLYRFSIFASYLYYLYKIPFIGTALRETIPIAMDTDKDVRALNTHDLYSPEYINRHYADELYEWYEEEAFEKMKPSHYLLGMRAIKRTEVA